MSYLPPSDPYADERKLVPCCIHLRTKTQFYLPEEMKAGPGTIKVTGTGVYWCMKTSTSTGPDDAPCRPQTCQIGRECYERPEGT